MGWRFGLGILFVVVVVAGAMDTANPARAQSDAELDALNREVQQLHRAGKYREAIAVAGRYVEAARKKR
jgi:hypothetical protein